MRSRMQAAGGGGVSPGRVLTSPLSPRAAGAAGSAPPGGSEESSRDSSGKRVAAAGSSSTGGSSKYAADRSGEAQGDVLRARRAQASPMGSPVGSPAGASREPPLSPKGAGFDEGWLTCCVASVDCLLGTPTILVYSCSSHNTAIPFLPLSPSFDTQINTRLHLQCPTCNRHRHREALPRAALSVDS